MARKQSKWLVHVWFHEDSDYPKSATGMLIEAFRYAGFIFDVREDCVEDKSMKSGLAFLTEFWMRAPRDVDGEAWARMNAQRMQTMGFNASYMTEDER